MRSWIVSLRTMNVCRPPWYVSAAASSLFFALRHHTDAYIQPVEPDDAIYETTSTGDADSALHGVTFVRVLPCGSPKCLHYALDSGAGKRRHANPSKEPSSGSGHPRSHH